MCFVHPPLLHLPPWAGQTMGQIWTCLGVGNWFDLLAVSRWLLWIVLWNKAVLMVNGHQVEVVEEMWIKEKKTNMLTKCVFVWISVWISKCNLCDHALSFSSSLSDLAYYKLFYPHAAWTFCPFVDEMGSSDSSSAGEAKPATQTAAAPGGDLMSGTSHVTAWLTLSLVLTLNIFPFRLFYCCHIFVECLNKSHI